MAIYAQTGRSDSVFVVATAAVRVGKRESKTRLCGV